MFNKKVVLFFKIFFAIIAFLLAASLFVDYYKYNELIKLKEKYNEVYVNSNNGLLFYEKENQKIYVNKVYNKENNENDFEFEENITYMMYCDKENPEECIFYKDDIVFSMNPKLAMIIKLGIVLFLIFAISSFNVYNDKKELLEKKNFIFQYIAFICFFIILVYAECNAVKDIYNFYKYKNYNNIAKATIYSKLYTDKDNNNKNKQKDKFISYYYVNGKKYTHISKYFDEKNADHKNFNIYYDDKNPNISYSKNEMNFVYFMSVFDAIIIILFTKIIPYKNFKKRMIGTDRKESTWKL